MDMPNPAIPEGFVPFPINIGFVDLIGPLYMKPADPEGVIGFLVEDKHVNPVGICHGGMLMAVADMAVGFASLTESGRKVFPPSINNTFDFLAVGKLGDWLETKVTFVKTTGSMGFADGIIHSNGDPIVRFNGICKLPKDNDPRFTRKDNNDKVLKAVHGD